MEFSAVSRVPAELAELLGDRHRPAWMAQAACRGLDPARWYEPLQGERNPNRELATAAKRICAECPVQAACLEYGLRERYGVWGGRNERERRSLARRRRCCA